MHRGLTGSGSMIDGKGTVPTGSAHNDAMIDARREVDRVYGALGSDSIRRAERDDVRFREVEASCVLGGARGLLHIQEADAIEAREASGAESPSSLHHLAAGLFAHAWAVAEELDDFDLVEEVLKDAKRNVAVYDATEAKLEEVRRHLETMRRTNEADARAS